MQVASVVIIVFHILLWLFDSLPFLYIMVGIASHLAYLAQLRYFPFIDFAGVAFLASCGKPTARLTAGVGATTPHSTLGR